jgi:hypothetical protein
MDVTELSLGAELQAKTTKRRAILKRGSFILL